MPASNRPALSVFAVDWSGAQSGQRRKIWLAGAAAGRLRTLEAGRTREQLIAHLIDLARATPTIAVGFDFSFSLPAWFLRQHDLASAFDLWRLVEREGERWLATVPPPFWGRARRRRPPADSTRPAFRHTESQLPSINGIRPKSTFQLGGAGAVGTSSLRGMPHLLALRRAGFAIYPFDPPTPPVAFEIYPRFLTGPTNKSSPSARSLALLAHAMSPALRSLGESSEDAFDAALSAIALSAAPLHLPAPTATELLEGRIHVPLPPDFPARYNPATRGRA